MPRAEQLRAPCAVKLVVAKVARTLNSKGTSGRNVGEGFSLLLAGIEEAFTVCATAS